MLWRYSLLFLPTGKVTHFIRELRIGTREVLAQLLQLPLIGHVCNTVFNTKCKYFYALDTNKNVFVPKNYGL